MTKLKDYIQMKRMFICRECKTPFGDLEEARNHIISTHGLEIEIPTAICIRCKKPFIPIIKDQVVCNERKCILFEAYNETAEGDLSIKPTPSQAQS